MNPLVVTAYYDIGRGGWTAESRPSDVYVRSFAEYTARMSDALYVLCGRATADRLGRSVPYLDVANIEDLAAYRYFARTADVMARPAFRALFRPEDDARHVEHLHPLYNIVTLAKWDALERAYSRTGGAHSHYVWADFALGKRVLPRPSLPAFERLAPVERDKIVLSASAGFYPGRDCRTLTQWVRTFRDLSSGNIMIVPKALLGEYVALARSNYARLLDCGLACDDQLVIDMCLSERPDLFYVSYQRRRGRGRYAHAHDIACGTDIPTVRSHTARFVFGTAARLRNLTGRGRRHANVSPTSGDSTPS